MRVPSWLKFGAAAPNFSHDGTRIVYTSTNANQDGRMGVGTADLYTIPYADRAGGAATPVAGAADSAFAEYYPAFSPDDKLIAFNRLPQADANVTPTGQPYDGGMYLNPAAEIWVVPSQGGTGQALRLRANDPPVCTPVGRWRASAAPVRSHLGSARPRSRRRGSGTCRRRTAGPSASRWRPPEAGD